MIKIVLLFMLLISSMVASDEKIDQNILAQKILLEKQNYENLTTKIENLNNSLIINKKKLSNAILKIKELDKQLNIVNSKKNKIEQNVIDNVSQKYSINIGIDLINKNSFTTLVEKELYKIVLENAKNNIQKLDENYTDLNKQIKQNKNSKKKLNQFIKEQENIKEEHEEMQKKHASILISLNKKYTQYQQSLKIVNNEENKIKSILINLISSKKNNQINTKYKDEKTISPLKSYNIKQNFGKYKDKVYKNKLFSNSIILQTKTHNSKVYNLFTGKIVYVEQETKSLKNIVIIKHKSNLYLVYTYLDKISPTIKVGNWIKKGYVVGRVHKKLKLYIYKDKKFINPIKLFKR